MNNYNFQLNLLSENQIVKDKIKIDEMFNDRMKAYKVFKVFKDKDDFQLFSKKKLYLQTSLKQNWYYSKSIKMKI